MRKVRRIRRQGQAMKVVEEKLDAVPADAATIDAKVALIQELIPLGLMHVAESLQQEVEQLAGPRYARHGGQPGVVRYGSQPGSVYLADQKLGIQVPRVRDRDRNLEVPLLTYQRLQQPRRADEGGVRRSLAGGRCGRRRRCRDDACRRVPRNWRSWVSGRWPPPIWSPCSSTASPSPRTLWWSRWA